MVDRSAQIRGAEDIHKELLHLPFRGTGKDDFDFLIYSDRFGKIKEKDDQANVRQGYPDHKKFSGKSRGSPAV